MGPGIAGGRLGLDDFEGLWALSRQIHDRSLKPVGRMEGQARFERQDDRLVYEETGRLLLPGHPALEAGRKLEWREGDDGTIAVHYPDGRPFHRIWTDRLMSTDTHVCAPDIYHVEYDFRVWPHWRVTWRVVGPAKDYRLLTLYRRA